MTARQLLDGLLVLYWRDGVTQSEAAKLLGIRRDEFVELAELRRCCLIVEDAAWRYFLVQFNYAFTNCDPRCTKRNTGPEWDRAGRMYTDAELMRAPQSGPRNEGARVKYEVGHSPPGDPRVLPRVVGQRSLDRAA